MSVKDKLEAINKLKQRAAAGDLRAKAVLDNFLAGVRRGVQQRRRAQQEKILGLIDSGAFDHLVVQDGAEEGEAESEWRRERGTHEIAGAAESPLYARDELDVADDIMRNMPRADGLAHAAAIRSHKHAELVSQAAFQRINPVSVLKGILGNSASVSAASGPKEVANWVGAEVAETLPISVLLGPIDLRPSDIPPVAAVRAYAILKWATSACAVTAEVDIGRGSQLTVNGASMTVQVAVDEPPAGQDRTVEIKLSGAISFYPCVRTNPITRTKFVEQNAPNLSTTIAIPNFAKNVTVYRSDATKTVQINVLDYNGLTEFTILRAAQATAPDVQMDPLLLTGDATYLQLISGGSNFLNVIFELGI